MRTILSLLILSLIAAVPSAAHAQKERMVKARNEEKREERSENAGKHFNLAAAKYRNDKLDAAEEILKKNVDEFPEHFPSLALLAKIKYDKNEFEHARSWTLRALKLRPANKPMNMLAAKIFIKLNKPLKAYEFMNRANRSADLDESNEVKVSEGDLGDLQNHISASLKVQRANSQKFYVSKDAGQADKDVLASVPKVDDTKKLKIVVFAFEAKTSDSSNSGFGASVGEMVTTAIVQTGCFQVVERQQLAKVLKEQDFELNDAVDQQTAVKVGELMGVDAIVIGSVLKLGTQTELDSRVVKVQSGEILAAASSAYDLDPQIRSAVNTLTVALAKSVYK
jgi:TolB-like protein